VGASSGVMAVGGDLSRSLLKLDSTERVFCFLIYGRVKVAQLKEAAATLGLERDHGEYRVSDCSTRLQVRLQIATIAHDSCDIFPQRSAIVHHLGPVMLRSPAVCKNKTPIRDMKFTSCTGP
jgi:hypothetical protein